MKKILLIAAAASMSLTSTLAMAKPGHGHGYGHNKHHDARAWQDSDRDGIRDRDEWNRDRDRDGRPDQYDRYDNRYSYRAPSYGYAQPYGYSNYGYSNYGYSSPWQVGQRYPYYNQSGYVLNDWRSYGLPAPRPGYQYYRSNNGDVIMAAIAGGLIGLVLGNVLNNNNHRSYNDGYYYRR